MGSELLIARLHSRYGENGSTSNHPTPVQIERQIEMCEKLAEISEQTGIDNLRLLEKVCFNPKTGMLKPNVTEVVTNFNQALDNIQESTEGREMIDNLDGTFVRGDGSIRQKDLRDSVTR